MSSIETIGLGAGSYPDNDLEDLYEYEYTITMQFSMKVNAKNEFEAKAILEDEIEDKTYSELVRNSEYAEITKIDLESVN